MIRVGIIGCGVVGAAIAYELSRVPGLKITVFDKQPPAQGATSAALGVLMGIVSQKVKGRNWQLREASVQRYETLIPELEALTGRKIPFNRQGILMLCFEGENMEKWEKLAEIRRSQGYNLEIWDIAKIQAKCPQLNLQRIIAAIYSPSDRQVDPTALTHALIDAAQRNGVTFEFGVEIEEFETTTAPSSRRVCRKIRTTSGLIEVDWLAIAAGLGSANLTSALAQPVDIRPVLGQALQVRLEQPIGNVNFQPVITGDDIHIVPLSGGDYWVGATVEFPAIAQEIVAVEERLEEVWQQAIALCPVLAEATIIRTWSGLRPRPEKQAAPVIGLLPGYSNVLLATGHYRNGILLAPATALEITKAIPSEPLPSF